MKTSLLTATLAVMLSLPPALAQDFTAKVIGVSDGDTITVLHDTKPEKIRLAEIDCPEKTQAFGAAAKHRTSELAFGKIVTVDVIGHDRYKRSIAQVELPDGRNLNRELVDQGLAWCYRKYSNNPDLISLEAKARDSRRGLWSAPNPVPPWTFRKQEKTSSQGNFAMP